eukprot:9483065-Pyramimonas_sp.AAC.1
MQRRPHARSTLSRTLPRLRRGPGPREDHVRRRTLARNNPWHRAQELTMDKQPTSPLGVSGLERFLLAPPFFPFGEELTPAPRLGLEGAFREVLERPSVPRRGSRHH